MDIKKVWKKFDETKHENYKKLILDHKLQLNKARGENNEKFKPKN